MQREIIEKFREATQLNKYHLIGPDRNREVYFGDEKILWASTGNYVISNKNYPLVGTYGLGPCIAIAGRDKIKNISFISHNLPRKDLEKLNDFMFEDLIDRGIKKENLEFYLISNNEEKIYGEYVKQYLNSIVKNPKIIYQDLENFEDTREIGKSFILDSRNGHYNAFPGFQINY